MGATLRGKASLSTLSTISLSPNFSPLFFLSFSIPVLPLLLPSPALPPSAEAFFSFGALNPAALLTVFFHASFLASLTESASVYPGGGTYVRRVLFWLPRLPPRALGLIATGAGDGDSRPALFSALLFQSSNHPIPRHLSRCRS